METEAAFLERVRRFDQDALADVYDRYSPAIYRYAARLLGNGDQAEECVSETFSRFLMALRNGHGPQEHLQAYLYRIAHNWITDTYRRQPPPALPLDPELNAGSEHDPQHAVAERLDQQKVRSALQLLTPEQRQIITLRFLEDLPIEDVAQAVAKPVGAVKSLQHRALAALRRLLIPVEEKNYVSAE
jgi:RNA polymerase sigma-70 factor (ECF subfamily)